EQLVEIQPDGTLNPKLATEWGSTPDAKVWTFKIRKGVQFHNGKDMTADDVVATMERHSDANSKSGALGVMKGIESVK
ncbi:ABC transporter substrate-binding protein, partial [Escherichia coli]|uniref:ABC transporter substrate-binding protein n=3 Tax=Pseudomonadota TaxID=1224 RepID=UPI00207D2BB3